MKPQRIAYEYEGLDSHRSVPDSGSSHRTRRLADGPGVRLRLHTPNPVARLLLCRTSDGGGYCLLVLPNAIGPVALVAMAIVLVSIGADE